ncbi:hypothetical protein [Streptosporangium sp. NPDC000396]|uniref:hypothetical protein n=1 Tax=Streptosporangium sp. NPDC000396 TaxID=3366185 RepID=UPI0036AE1CA8
MALAHHDNTLWIAIRATDGALVAAQQTSGGAWSTTHNVGTAAVTALGAPAAASHNDKLHVMYRR